MKLLIRKLAIINRLLRKLGDSSYLVVTGRKVYRVKLG